METNSFKIDLKKCLNSDKKKSLISTARDEMNINRKIVMTILDYDDLEHNMYLYNCALDFLELNASKNDQNILESMKAFWSWYRIEWSKAQDSFIKRAITLNSTPLSFLRNLYKADMRFFCIDSEAIIKSFNNFIQCQRIK